MLGEALAVEGAEVGLGVADVDREEHSADYRRELARAASAQARRMPRVNVRLYVAPRLASGRRSGG